MTDRRFIRSLPCLLALGCGSAVAATTIDLAVAHQTIDGFGASDAFLDQPLTDAQADFYFTTQGNGIGLSWLRMGIDEDGGLVAHIDIWSDASKAIARGARVWAAPWTAPAAWKDNNSANGGGHLCAAAGQGSCDGNHYADWATRLASFAQTFKDHTQTGLYGISIQNEPDYTATTYRSMLVSNTEMVNFINVLGPKLALLPGQHPLVIAGDYSNWAYLDGMAAAVDANASAHAYTAIYATHQYWLDVTPESLSRPVWQTEMSSFEAFDPSLANGVTVAKWIHTALVEGNVAAWHYWWLYNPYNESNEGLIGHPADRAATTKRVYALGNYAKFVRPGWKRVDVAGVTDAHLHVSAFRSDGGNVAIVVINDDAGDRAFSATLAHAHMGAVTPWTTTATADLQPQALLPVSANVLSASVQPGITTFVSDTVFANSFE